LLSPLRLFLLPTVRSLDAPRDATARMISSLEERDVVLLSVVETTVNTVDAEKVVSDVEEDSKFSV
jgi:hypothetical protein